MSAAPSANPGPVSQPAHPLMVVMRERVRFQVDLARQYIEYTKTQRHPLTDARNHRLANIRWWSDRPWLIQVLQAADPQQLAAAQPDENLRREAMDMLREREAFRQMFLGRNTGAVKNFAYKGVEIDVLVEVAAKSWAGDPTVSAGRLNWRCFEFHAKLEFYKQCDMARDWMWQRLWSSGSLVAAPAAAADTAAIQVPPGINAVQGGHHDSRYTGAVTPVQTQGTWPPQGQGTGRMYNQFTPGFPPAPTAHNPSSHHRMPVPSHGAAQVSMATLNERAAALDERERILRAEREQLDRDRAQHEAEKRNASGMLATATARLTAAKEMEQAAKEKYEAAAKLKREQDEWDAALRSGNLLRRGDPGEEANPSSQQTGESSRAAGAGPASTWDRGKKPW